MPTVTMATMMKQMELGRERARDLRETTVYQETFTHCVRWLRHHGGCGGIRQGH